MEQCEIRTKENIVKDLICPITLMPLFDCVMADDGFFYNEFAIMQILDESYHPISPKTGQYFKSKNVIKCVTVRNIIIGLIELTDFFDNELKKLDVDEIMKFKCVNQLLECSKILKIISSLVDIFYSNVNNNDYKSMQDVYLLLERNNKLHEIDVNHKFNDSKNLLMKLFDYHRIFSNLMFNELVMLNIEKIDMQYVDNNGNTLLHNVIDRCSFVVLPSLLKCKNFDVHKKNKNGLTVFDILVQGCESTVDSQYGEKIKKMLEIEPFKISNHAMQFVIKFIATNEQPEFIVKHCENVKLYMSKCAPIMFVRLLSVTKYTPDDMPDLNNIASGLFGKIIHQNNGEYAMMLLNNSNITIDINVCNGNKYNYNAFFVAVVNNVINVAHAIIDYKVPIDFNNKENYKALNACFSDVTKKNIAIKIWNKINDKLIFCKSVADLPTPFETSLESQYNEMSLMMLTNKSVIDILNNNTKTNPAYITKILVNSCNIYMRTNSDDFFTIIMILLSLDNINISVDVFKNICINMNAKTYEIAKKMVEHPKFDPYNVINVIHQNCKNEYAMKIIFMILNNINGNHQIAADCLLTMYKMDPNYVNELINKCNVIKFLEKNDKKIPLDILIVKEPIIAKTIIEKIIQIECDKYLKLLTDFEFPENIIEFLVSQKFSYIKYQKINIESIIVITEFLKLAEKTIINEVSINQINHMINNNANIIEIINYLIGLSSDYVKMRFPNVMNVIMIENDHAIIKLRKYIPIIISKIVPSKPVNCFILFENMY